MKSRVLTILLAFGVFGAVLSGAVAVAAPAGPTLACPSGEICVWSGANYTGSMATIPDNDGWHGCSSAAELGLSAIRSAQRNGVGCHLQASLHADTVCGTTTDPDHIQTLTPTITPAALSIDRFMIPC